MELKLKGEITIGEEQLEEIKKQLRKEILKEMMEDEKLTFEEVVKCIVNFNYKTFFRLISETVPVVLEKVDKSESFFDSRIYNSIVTIRSICNLVK